MKPNYLKIALTGAMISSLHAVDTATTAWNGSTVLWTTAGNWSGGVPSSSLSALFDSTFISAFQPQLQGTSTVQGIYFKDGVTQNVTITGLTSARVLNINGDAELGGQTNAGIMLDDVTGTNNNLTIGNLVTTTLTNNTGFYVNSAGALILNGSGTLNLNTKTLTLGGNNASGSINISQVISGATTSAINVNTSGTVTLSGANTFVGGLTLTAGTLKANTSAAALGAGALALDGGILDFNHSAALAFNRNTTIGGDTTIISNRSVAAQAGVNYTLGTLGIGTYTLSVQGGSNVTSGTAGVVFGATTFSGNSTFDVTDPTGGGVTNLTLGALNQNGLGRVITKQGSGTLTLGTAATSLTNLSTININAGTLNITNLTGAGTAVLNLTSGARLEVGVANYANLASLATANGGSGVVAGSFLRYSTAQTAAGVGANPGTIFGTVELNVTNVNPNYVLDFGTGGKLTNVVTAAYTSALTLSGAATFQNGGTTLTLSGGLNNNGNLLTVDGSGTTTFGNTANIITGGGGITKNGTGVLILNGSGTQASHNFGGTITVNNGTLMVYSGAAGSIGTGNITLNGGVLEEYWGGTFNRALGLGAGQVQLTGGVSGFSENGIGQTAIINLGGAGAVVIWGASGEGAATGFFNPTKLQFNTSASQTTANTTFQNALNLNGTTRTVTVSGGTTGVATAIMSGLISNSTGTAGIIKEGAGALTINNNSNSFNGDIEIKGGTLTFTGLNAMGGASKNVSFTGNGTLAYSTGSTFGQLSVGNGFTATMPGGSNGTFASATGSGTIVVGGGAIDARLRQCQCFYGQYKTYH